MIVINLLPPQYRKRTSGVSPIFASIAVGGTLCLAMAGFWWWIKAYRIPAMQVRIDAANDEIAKLREDEAKVNKFEADTAEAAGRRDMLEEIYNTAVPQAPVFDAYLDMLDQFRWEESGFMVSTSNLEIVPTTTARGSAAEKTQVNEWRWNMKLVGKGRASTGENLVKMWAAIKSSSYWQDYGFVGQPQDTWHGDSPFYNDTLKASTTTASLVFVRNYQPPKMEIKKKVDK